MLVSISLFLMIFPMSFLNQLEWRNATKDFDPSKKVSDEDLKKIQEAIQFAPSSFGLQPYHVLVVTDQETKEKLLPHAWNQPQITDCSQLLVFCSRSDIKDRVESYMQLATGGNAEARESMKAYEGMMLGFVEGKDEAWFHNWASRQAYIALGFAMAAAAELQIDSCPMEGFSMPDFDEILNLPEHLSSRVLLPLGYRKEDPKYPKVRFNQEDLFDMR